MFFVPTSEEQTAREALVDAQGRLRMAEQQVTRFPMDDLSDAAVSARQAVVQAVKQAAAAVEAPALHRFALKEKLNATVAKVIGDSTPGVLLPLVDEAAALLDSAESQHTYTVARALLLRWINLGADEELHMASARVLAVKYKAYTSVGLPLDFVHAILLKQNASPDSGAGAAVRTLGGGVQALGKVALAARTDDGMNDTDDEDK
jgi:hypothetical protein